MEIKKKILYFDMDGVLVDFESGIKKLPTEIQEQEDKSKLDEVEGLFGLMDPMPGAIEAVKILVKYFDVYILSTCPWNNISGASQKIAWIKKYFGDAPDSPFYKRVILTHNKHLAIGDFLIDDRTKNGAANFQGELIQFGNEKFPNWEKITEYLIDKVSSSTP